MPTTYTKLKSGNWGIRSTTALTKGDSVIVVKKSGESKVEIVEKVLFAQDGVWIAAIQATSKPVASTSKQRTSRGRRTGCSCGSIEGTPRDSDCQSCQFENFDQ